MALHLLAPSALLSWVSAEGETPPAEPVRYVDPATVGPGFIGFVLFMFLVVAVFLLWKSMNKQLAKIDFEEPADAPRPVNAPFSAPDEKVPEGDSAQ